MKTLKNTAVVTTGSFRWENGIKDTRVLFYPNKDGRFKISLGAT